MGRFNLLDEPWISVIQTDDGREKDVSIVDLFQNAAKYRRLGGMETQNFAILRVLLAILQTVFSRYDDQGQELVELDDKMRQTEEIDEDEEETAEEYEEAVTDSWKNLWRAGHFPDILFRYLDVWKDHFYLLDERFPFYQITSATMDRVLPPGKKATVIDGRFLNKEVSESGNKTALFSPRMEGKNKTNKDVLTEAELARWMIVFQGYTGLADKTTLATKEQRNSKGWLFDLGGIYVEGKNLYETLMLNYIPFWPGQAENKDSYRYKIQKPCWEFTDEEVIQRLRAERPIDNLAELYTNWSRAVVLDPFLEFPAPVSIQAAKLPEIKHTDQFLEPMTLWRKNKAGENKEHYSPRKHVPEQAMWRSFGLFALPSSEDAGTIRPVVLTQLVNLVQVNRVVGDEMISLREVSMQDDGNATSWMPADEITDVLHMNDLVFTDDEKQGWIVRITGVIQDTKDVIEILYRRFLTNVAELRNLGKRSTSFISKGLEDFYQAADIPFRQWLAEIRIDDSIEAREFQWRNILRNLAFRQAEKIVAQAGNRDYTGIEQKDGRTLNIATAYLLYQHSVYGKLGREVKEGVDKDEI